MIVRSELSGAIFFIFSPVGAQRARAFRVGAHTSAACELGLDVFRNDVQEGVVWQGMRGVGVSHVVVRRDRDVISIA